MNLIKKFLNAIEGKTSFDPNYDYKKIESISIESFDKIREMHFKQGWEDDGVYGGNCFTVWQWIKRPKNYNPHPNILSMVDNYPEEEMKTITVQLNANSGINGMTAL